MRFIIHLCCLLTFLITPGCEIGRSWMSMNSDSPSPFFGFDLLPKRRTSQTISQPVAPHNRESVNGASRAGTHSVGSRSRPANVTSRELHLPSIPAFFDGDQMEELSFTGPEGAFSR